MVDETKEASEDKGGKPKPAEETNSPAKKKTTFSAFSKVKTAKTEEYADDSNLYEPRVNRDDRLQYYANLVQNNKIPYTLPPKDFDSWVNQNSATEKLLEKYADRLKKTLQFITSPNWDFAYIYGFILWVLLTAVVTDGFVPESLGFTYQSPIVALPIVVMIVSQICPAVGSILLIRHCNDLTRQLAQIDFINWSVVSVLLMQYMERFYYGGVYKSESAGSVSGMVGNVTWWQIFKVVVLGRKWVPPKIHPELELQPSPETALVTIDESKEENDADDDDEDEESDNDNDEVGDLKSAAKSEASQEDKSKVTVDSAAQGQSEKNDGSSDGSEGEEVGYLAQLRKKREKELAEQKKRELEARLALEATVTDWTEWDCVCCGQHNRRPSVMPASYDIKFGSKGVFYKRHYAKLKKKSTKPDCLRCYTPCDYVPPLSTAHYFNNNPKKGVAFEQYPKTATLHPGLKTDKTSLYKNSVYRFFFGIDSDQHSMLLANDWRLPKYLATIFPEVPRYEKPPEEYFEIGEFVESKYQKVDWSRCMIRNVHSNHTYDIRFNTGDEIRFVYEVHLRCPPLKGKYAYRVELAMTVMYILFPVTLLGAIAAAPALLFIVPFLVSIVLIILRSRAAVLHYRAASNSGTCAVFRLWLFFTFPLIMLVIMGMLGLSANYSGAVVCLIVAKIGSLPVLYSMRATWAIFGSAIFLFSSIGLFMLTLYVNGELTYLSAAMGPLLLAALVVRKFRMGLGSLWDVQLKTRVPRPQQPVLVAPAGSVTGSVDNNDVESASRPEGSSVD